MPQTHLTERRRAVLTSLLQHVEDREALLILKAPPGSGKTHVILRAVALSLHRRQRVAVATQTNAQADDFCRRMADEFPRVPVIRFAGAGQARGGSRRLGALGARGQRGAERAGGGGGHVGQVGRHEHRRAL
jgi:late competence protein required for DNA uptake (superfamily II DNA/RNA helicase)